MNLMIPLICLFLLVACTNNLEAPRGPINKQESGESSAAKAGEGSKSKGIGPVTEMKLEALSPELARQGKILFDAKCSVCHKIGGRYVGPDLKDLTRRRRPEWIMNMILNPVEMTQKDPQAQELFSEYLIQMTFQNVTQEEARQLLEYFRLTDGTR